MLSGIGDETELSKIGVETVVNISDVGKNLQVRRHNQISLNKAKHVY